jgi:hypothetical protein
MRLRSCWRMSFNACNRSTQARSWRYSALGGSQSAGFIATQNLANNAASARSVLLRASSDWANPLIRAGFTTLTRQPASTKNAARFCEYGPVASRHTWVLAGTKPFFSNQSCKARCPDALLGNDFVKPDVRDDASAYRSSFNFDTSMPVTPMTGVEFSLIVETFLVCRLVQGQAQKPSPQAGPGYRSD